MSSILREFVSLWRKVRRDRRGNVLMIFGFALLPITFATGMGIDYARAARIQTRLNAITDAAALAGVTPGMLSQSRGDSILAAYKVWYAQAGLNQCQVGPVNYVIFKPCTWSGNDNGSVYTFSDGTLSIVVTDTNVVGLSRSIKLSYEAQSANIFAGILKAPTIGIGGTTTTNAKTAPDIDFYVLLDTSGSMQLPATSSGLALLKSKTGGCAFACHSTNDKVAKDASNKNNDYYGVAKSFGIPLRSEEATKAVQGMMSQATSLASGNNASYRAALMSFAARGAPALNTFSTLQSLTGTLSSVSTAAGNAPVSLYYTNGCPKKDQCNNDTDSAPSQALTNMNSLMPAPGNGTKVALDKPQEIMFVITDGMRDEIRANGQPEVQFDAALCQVIKDRGIRIAVLYTEYLKEAIDNDDWSVSTASDKGNVLGRLPLIEPALQSCASSGLYYKVTTDDDISAALNKLFIAAVSNAHITQ